MEVFLDTTDCIVGLNCFFVDKIRDFRIRNFEYFETPEQFLCTWTFEKIKQLETDFSEHVSMIDFADTLF